MNGRHSEPGRFTRRRLLTAAAVAVGVTALEVDRVSPGRASVPVRPPLVTRCRFGAHAANEPYPQQPHFALEEAVRHPLPVTSWFVDFPGTWIRDAAEALQQRGNYDILMCWQPAAVHFRDILAGTYDRQIRFLLTASRSYVTGNLIIRFAHEANGDWYDWAPASGRGFVDGPEQYVAAWRHVVTIAREANPQALFFWCVNNGDKGGTALESLYPDDAYVDVIGVDAYCFGHNGSFGEINAEAYERVTRLHNSAPYWIGECGIDDQSGSAAWYRAAYNSTRFPRLTTVCWFSSGPFTLTTDADALAVHRRQLARIPSATLPRSPM